MKINNLHADVMEKVQKYNKGEINSQTMFYEALDFIHKVAKLIAAEELDRQVEEIKKEHAKRPKCPICGSRNIMKEKMLNGRTFCLDCGYVFRDINGDPLKEIKPEKSRVTKQVMIDKLRDLIDNSESFREKDPEEDNIWEDDMEILPVIIKVIEATVPDCFQADRAKV